MQIPHGTVPYKSVHTIVKSKKIINDKSPKSDFANKMDTLGLTDANGINSDHGGLLQACGE